MTTSNTKPEPGELQGATPASVIEVAGPDDFEQLVLEPSRRRPVVVDFWAAWCGPCLALGPVLEREVEALSGAVELVKLDVDAAENRPLAERFGIRGIPAVKAFRDGAVVDEFVGALAPQAVQAFLERLVAPPAAEQIVTELRQEAELLEVVAALEDGDLERALALLLEQIEQGDKEGRERVRSLMLRLFGDLGAEHPLAVTYRRRLAAALF
jgi:putative thioredoxin